jgi:hypothetical protein
MLPFKIAAVVVCDDVRQEQDNNKYILIGVYNGTLITPAFPASIPLSWWIQLFPETLGEVTLDVQLVREDESILLRGTAGLQINALDWSAMVLPKVQVQFQSAGKLKLQLKMQDQGDWQTVQELVVRQGDLPSIGPSH